MGFKQIILIVFVFGIVAACGKMPTIQNQNTSTQTSTSTSTDTNTVQPIPCKTGASAFDGGSGTQADPYLVSTSDELFYMGCNNNFFFKLTTDIDFSQSKSPFPISFIGGGFDGGGHTLSNLSQSLTTNPAGLFVTIADGATVQNLNLSNANVSVTSVAGVGGLANTIRNATVQNCNVTGTIKGTIYAGGLVGYSYQSTVTNSTFNGTVASQSPSSTTTGGGSNVGGLVGNTFNSTVTHSSSSGTVRGSGNYVGGLIGVVSGTTVNTSWSNAGVTGGTAVGGLAGGTGFTSQVNNSYALGAVLGSGNVGGLVGDNEATAISTSYSAGLVTASFGGGGLVGFQANGGTVAGSYWDMNTSSQPTSAGGTGETTANMQTQSTYSAWDFTNIWQISSGNYPTLR